MSQQYYIRVRGKVSGPFDLYQLRTLQERGGLARFHEISTDQQNWVPALALSELFPSGVMSASGGQRPEGPAESYKEPAEDPALDEPIWHYLDRQGAQQGPVSLRQIEQFFRAGQLDGSALVWKAGMTDWLALPSIDPVRFGSGQAEWRGAGFGAQAGAYAAPRDPGAGWRQIHRGISLVTLGILILASVAFACGILGFVGFLSKKGGLMVIAALIAVPLTAAVQGILAVVCWLWMSGNRAIGGATGLALTCAILAAVGFGLDLTYFILLLAAKITQIEYHGDVLFEAMTHGPGAILLAASICFAVQATLMIYHLRSTMIRLGAMGLAWHMWLTALLFLVLAFLSVLVHVLLLLRSGEKIYLSDLAVELMGMFLWLLAMAWSAYALMSLQRIRGTLADWIQRSYPR
jgi:hypothetical protein